MDAHHRGRFAAARGVHPRRARRPMAQGDVRRRQVPETLGADQAVRVRGVSVLSQGAGGGGVARSGRAVLPVPPGRTHLPRARQKRRRQVPVSVHGRRQHRREHVRVRRHHRLPVRQVRSGQGEGADAAEGRRAHGAHRGLWPGAEDGRGEQVQAREDAREAHHRLLVRGVSVLQARAGETRGAGAASPDEDGRAGLAQAPGAEGQAGHVPGSVHRGS
mmetsp:Transcript_499/g.1760  ORF Transcript_499/g.1760 Transcript_499/m.1760 type:complete len:218 (-) Transcript_499:168-821(-)